MLLRPTRHFCRYESNMGLAAFLESPARTTACLRVEEVVFRCPTSLYNPASAEALRGIPKISVLTRLQKSDRGARREGIVEGCFTVFFEGFDAAFFAAGESSCFPLVLGAGTVFVEGTFSFLAWDFLGGGSKSLSDPYSSGSSSWLSSSSPSSSEWSGSEPESDSSKLLRFTTAACLGVQAGEVSASGSVLRSAPSSSEARLIVPSVLALDSPSFVLPTFPASATAEISFWAALSPPSSRSSASNANTASLFTSQDGDCSGVSETCSLSCLESNKMQMSTSSSSA